MRMRMQEKHDSRSLVLCSEISDDSVKPLIEVIQEINDIDDMGRQSLREGKFNERPIKLVVNTPGGDVFAANALIAAMETSVTPIHTYVYGLAASAGLWVAVSGHVRFSHYMSRYMYHEIASWNMGKLEAQRRVIAELDELQKMMDSYLLEKTRITPAQLKKADLADWYFSAKDALNMGVCDYMFERIPKEKKEHPKKEPVKKEGKSGNKAPSRKRNKNDHA